jgi:hypothetical protein
MEKEKYVDAFLEKRIAKYDEWLGKGRISYASKVIPVSESFTTNVDFALLSALLGQHPWCSETGNE